MDKRKLNKYINVIKGELDNNVVVIFDLETTSISVEKDQVIQFAGVKIYPDGKINELNILVRPTCPISKEASNVHGHTAESLADKPTFEEIGQTIVDFFSDATIIAGYNIISFDIKLLGNQLKANNFPNILENKQYFDIFNLYKLHSTRKLADAVLYYTGNIIEDAHDALGDIYSSIAVMSEQLKREQQNIPTVLDRLSNRTSEIELERFIKKDSEGKLILSFGKYSGTPIEQVDKGFLSWVINKDFPDTFKTVCKKYINA